MTRGTQNITGYIQWYKGTENNSSSGAFTYSYRGGEGYEGHNSGTYHNQCKFTFDASCSWTGSTSSASPYTTAMGSGTPISINPEHITIKAWKRTK